VGVHVVELEAGSMRGSLPSTSSGMLVVMAGDTEVASLGPGAVFNVTRSSKRLVMHLERGSASVGTLGQRGAGRAFAAPLVAAFSLDGGVSFEVLEEETAALLPVSPVREARTAESPAPHEPQPRPLAPAVASHRPLELSSGPEQPSAPAPSASVAPSRPR
jgi:ferric-dicitrate binding protein FerR (iron transport regulator)